MFFKQFTEYYKWSFVGFFFFFFLTFLQATGEIEITIIDDNEVEFLEIFKIALVRVTGGARLGNDTLVTVAIPPNDSPLGVFGFEETKVSFI